MRRKNPIALARAVMEHSPYVMMVGTGADAFAVSQRPAADASPAYFFTEMRWQELLGVQRSRRQAVAAASGWCSRRRRRAWRCRMT